MMICRQFSICRRYSCRKYSIDYLTRHLPKPVFTPKTKPKTSTINENVVLPKEEQPRIPIPNAPKTVHHLIITPKQLTTKYRDMNLFPLPTSRVMNISHRFFFDCKAFLEWSYLEYEKVPDSTNPKYIPLPEVLFLGNTNCGKSTMINSLTAERTNSARGGPLPIYARVSPQPGFTQTVNCYNISGKFRLIDSPGYGQFGEEKQGKMVLDYLHNRKALKHVFMLIDSTKGFVDDDITMINHLIREEVPFEIILTKTDLVIQRFMKSRDINPNRLQNLRLRREREANVKVSNEEIVAYFDKIFGSIGLFELGVPIKMTFCNNLKKKCVGEYYGYKEIRCSIIESCGLADVLKK